MFFFFSLPFLSLGGLFRQLSAALPSVPRENHLPWKCDLLSGESCGGGVRYASPPPLFAWQLLFRSVILLLLLLFSFFLFRKNSSCSGRVLSSNATDKSTNTEKRFSVLHSMLRYVSSCRRNVTHFHLHFPPSFFFFFSSLVLFTSFAFHTLCLHVVVALSSLSLCSVSHRSTSLLNPTSQTKTNRFRSICT